MEGFTVGLTEEWFCEQVAIIVGHTLKSSRATEVYVRKILR